MQPSPILHAKLQCPHAHLGAWARKNERRKYWATSSSSSSSFSSCSPTSARPPWLRHWPELRWGSGARASPSSRSPLPPPPHGRHPAQDRPRNHQYAALVHLELFQHPRAARHGKQEKNPGRQEFPGRSPAATRWAQHAEGPRPSAAVERRETARRRPDCAAAPAGLQVGRSPAASSSPSSDMTCRSSSSKLWSTVCLLPPLPWQSSGSLKQCATWAQHPVARSGAGLLPGLRGRSAARVATTSASAAPVSASRSQSHNQPSWPTVRFWPVKVASTRARATLSQTPVGVVVLLCCCVVVLLCCCVGVLVFCCVLFCCVLWWCCVLFCGCVLCRIEPPEEHQRSPTPKDKTPPMCCLPCPFHAASSNPTNQQSLSTSSTDGASPSAPSAGRRSKREGPHHLTRQTCSARFFKTAGSPGARAFASHLPPTSPAITTNFARRPGCTTSGYVRSFLLWASSNATPSRSAAPRGAEPSQCQTGKRVVSTASWAPPYNGSPSTTTSNLRPSFAGTGRSRSRT